MRNALAAKERAQRQRLTTALNEWADPFLNDEQRGKLAQPIFALLKTNPTLHDARSAYGVTPLCVAAFHGNRDITQRLLDHAADPNAKDNDGKTPMDLAKQRGITDFISLFLKHVAKER